MEHRKGVIVASEHELDAAIEEASLDEPSLREWAMSLSMEELCACMDELRHRLDLIGQQLGGQDGTQE